MKKSSTLNPYDVNASATNVSDEIMCEESSPKADTLEKLRKYARVAFSDAALTGLPLIILN